MQSYSLPELPRLRRLRRRAASTAAGLCIASLVGLAGPATALAAGTLFFIDIFNPTFSDGSISRIETDGSGLDVLLPLGGGLRGIAIDPDAGFLYWTDVTADVIKRAHLDGTGVVTLVSSGLSFPMEVAIDPTRDLLFWGDQSDADIGVANLDGSGAQTLISTAFHSGLAVDAQNGKIYWSETIDGGNGRILRANMDGTSIETVVEGVDKPAKIALDVAGGKVYWTDYVADAVRRANLDGTNIQNLFVAGGNNNPDGIALDLVDGKVYWAQGVDANRDMIKRMNLDGTVVQDVASGFGLITSMDLRVSGTSSVDARPSALRLLTAAPNPTSGAAALGFEMPAAGPVRLMIYTADGRLVRTLRDGVLPAGSHQVLWDGSDDRGRAVPSGIYLGRLETAQGGGTLRIVRTR